MRLYYKEPPGPTGSELCQKSRIPQPEGWESNHYVVDMPNLSVEVFHKSLKLSLDASL